MIIQAMPCPASGSGGGGVTLDPGDVEGGITLSNGDLTATRDSSAAAFRSWAIATDGVASGKRRFQVTIDASSTSEFTIGLVGPAYLSRSTYLGQNAQSIGLNHGGGGGSGAGVIYNAGTQYGGGTTLPTGAVVDVFMDADAGKVWFAKNGVILNGDPAAGTGGTTVTMGKAWYPAAWLYGPSTAVTFNFGDTAWAYSFPSLTAFTGVTQATDPPASFRSVRLLVRDTGYFGHSAAEIELMASSGGANILNGSTITASASIFNPSGNPVSNWVDANAATWAATSHGSADAPNITITFDKGSNAVRNATHMAIRMRGDDPAAIPQTIRTFDIYCTTDNLVFHKAAALNLGTFTLGERKEVAL